MAITKLVSPSVPNPTVSGAGGSWDLAMAQLTACKKMLSGEQMILTQWTNATVLPALKLGSYLQHAGTIYVVDTSDYPITAPTSDGTYYIRLAVSAETLAVSFISSLSGYSWNTQHNGLYDSSNNQVLPYQIVRSGGNYAKRRILNPYHTTGFSTIDYLGAISATGAISGASLTVDGAISGASLSTTGNIAVGGTVDGHDIDSELDTLNGRVNQGVKTTDSPTFANATISGHNVDTQLDRINQDVKTTASPTFENLTTNKGIICEAFGTDSMTGDNIYDALYDRIKYPESGKRILLSGSFFLPNTNTQCIPITVAYYSSTNKYSIRYMMIGSKDNLLTIEVASGDSTVRITDAMIAIAGGKYTLPY